MQFAGVVLGDHHYRTGFPLTSESLIWSPGKVNSVLEIKVKTQDQGQDSRSRSRLKIGDHKITWLWAINSLQVFN